MCSSRSKQTGRSYPYFPLPVCEFPFSVPFSSKKNHFHIGHLRQRSQMLMMDGVVLNFMRRIQFYQRLFLFLYY